MVGNAIRDLGEAAAAPPATTRTRRRRNGARVGVASLRRAGAGVRLVRLLRALLGERGELMHWMTRIIH